MECHYPTCTNTTRTRGLCHQHYQTARAYIRAGKATAEDLVARGVMLSREDDQEAGERRTYAMGGFGALLLGSAERGGSPGACGCKGPGWFEGDTGIERCDECNAFADDNDARRHVAERFRDLIGELQDFADETLYEVIEEAIGLEPEDHSHRRLDESGQLIRRFESETEAAHG